MSESDLRESNSFLKWTITADDADARIARAIRICVGNHIRKMYGDVVQEPLPPNLTELLRRLDA